MTENMSNPTPLDFDFAGALPALKDGRMVARHSWSPEGTIYLQLQSSRTLGIPLDGDDTGSMLPFIAQKQDGCSKNWGAGSIDLLPWNPSHADMLANDWYIKTQKCSPTQGMEAFGQAAEPEVLQLLQGEA